MITEQPVNNHDDLLKVVDGMLKEVGLDRKDTGGEMTFAGMDPIRETVIKVGAASASVIATNAALNAIIWKARSGEGQDIHVDLRKAWAMQSAWQDVLVDCTMVNGVSRMGNPDWYGDNSNVQILPTLDKRFVMVSCPYPSQMLKMCKIFNTGFTHDQLAQASRKQTADDLEAMGNSAMLPITKVRTQEQFQASEQWASHASTPQIHIEKIGDSAPEPLGAAERPLSGIRSLSMVHIVAGPTIQRTLAAQGADCLNIHPPTWIEAPEFYFNCFAGLRQAAVDTPLDRGRDQVYKLIKDADVFVENLRPGLAAQEGYSPEELAEFRPGIICANVKLNTPGPWSGMCGFDMNGAALTGVLTECGTPDLEWDFRIPRVKSINASGHKFGLSPLGVGWAIWREEQDLPEEEVFWVNYLGGNMRDIALNFSRPGGQIMCQYYNFLRLGREGYRKIHTACYDTAKYISAQIAKLGPFEIIYDGEMDAGIPALCWKMKDGVDPGFSLYDLADRLRSRGWQVPAYSLPANVQNLSIQRILVRHGVSRDLGSLLVDDMQRAMDYFKDHPVHTQMSAAEASGFHH